MLGQPIFFTLPQVVGCKLVGSVNILTTSIDIVLGITKVRVFCVVLSLSVNIFVRMRINMQNGWKDFCASERGVNWCLCLCSTYARLVSVGSLWSSLVQVCVSSLLQTEPPLRTCVLNTAPLSAFSL